MNQVQEYIQRGAMVLPRGCPVIADEVDAAQSINIAIVQKVENGWYKCVYLWRRTNVIHAITKAPTPVFLFGRRLIVVDETVMIYDYYDSVATYKDGEQRPWRDPSTNFEITQVRKQALSILRPYLKMQHEIAGTDKD